MALPPGATDEAFLREVDEEVRRDQAMRIWQNYGRWIIGAVVGGLVIFAGYLIWQNRSESNAGKDGELYASAVEAIQQKQESKAEPELAKLARSGGEGYRALALLAQADLLIGKQDLKGAAAKYSEIAADTGLPQPFRDEALLRQTQAEYDTLKPEVVIDRLKGLASPGSAWFGGAGEMVAAAYLKQGKRDAAGKLYAQIAQTQDPVPDSIRQRAVQMAGVLGVDAIDQTKGAQKK